MRIGLVSPYSFDVPGGVQLHVRDLATYLLAEGHEVSVLAPSDGDDAGAPYVRWAFCKQDAVLDEAVRRLGQLTERPYQRLAAGVHSTTHATAT